MSSHQFIGGRARRKAGRDGRSLAQDGDPVADAADLVETMRDVDDADAIGGEPTHDVEHRLDLGVVEDRRRLVHDEQANVVRQRSCDRHDLLAGGTQVSDQDVRRDALVVHPAEQLGGLPAHPGSVEQAPPAELVAEEDVLGDGEVLDQIALLVDRRDTLRQRIRRVARHRFAVDADLARPSARWHRRCT